MRLTSAEVNGFGRIAAAKINLDGKVIAIVGPNETGKTTLLKALAYLSSDDELSASERARGIDISDDSTVVLANFVLDDNDRLVVADLNLEEPPKSMTVERRAAGGVPLLAISPAPMKNRSSLRLALQDLERYANDSEIEEYVDPDTIYADPGSDAARSYPDELSTLISELKENVLFALDEETTSALGQNAENLLNVTVDTENAKQLRLALQAVVDWLGEEDPEPQVRNRLWDRTPAFILFGETDRTLNSTYVLNDSLLDDIPGALANLAGMAALNLEDLFSHHQAGDIGRRQTLLLQANARLRELFASAWKQSTLSVQLHMDGTQLRIMVTEDGENVTVFSERSAGLRMFVALMAFLQVHGTHHKPVLLIDEAENHLHIDAQADLVDMFTKQQQAAKVIYTTHSPACLPPDLGSGIRSVVPRRDNQFVSDVRNNFWGAAPGFTPLMMAMGAAAAAFTPARRVVLAEGATEMILLPSLIRAATGMTTLDYQIAPGLSESSKDLYSRLDLEGARVAYLVDGDSGGNDLRKSLIRAGIPESLIVVLDVPGLENVLEQRIYRETVRSLLEEINDVSSIEEIPELPPSTSGSWSNHITTWAESAHLSMPSKVAVAARLVENGPVRLSDESIDILKEVHRRLSAVLS